MGGQGDRFEYDCALTCSQGTARDHRKRGHDAVCSVRDSIVRPGTEHGAAGPTLINIHAGPCAQL